MKPLTPSSPHAIIMLGIPGSGKSTFAEHFAETFQAPIINESRIAFEAGLNAEQAKKTTAVMLNEVLKTHSTFLFEAPNLTKAKRADFIKKVTNAGFRPLLVWVQTEAYEAKRRALKPLPAGSGMNDEEFDKTFNNFQPPVEQEKVTVISGKHTYATQLKIVLKQLASTRPETPIIPPAPRPGNRVIIR